MNLLKHTRFGDIEYDDDKVITFPKGLLGFESLRNFVVIPSKNEGPLFWIQSAEDPQVAFVVTDPTTFYPDYGVLLEPQEKEVLQLEDEDECSVLIIASVREGGVVTLNMMAPVLLSPKARRAIQVIVEAEGFSTQQPLPQTNP